MPASDKESIAITSIINEFLSPDQAKEIVKRLNDEVGNKTDNLSLKVSLEMLKSLYEPPAPKSKKMQVFLWSLVAIHMIILVFNCIAMIALAFLAPWYIALPIITLMVNFMFSPIPCPLTRLESRIRRSLEMPEVRFFIKYYIVDPFRKWRSGRQLK